MTQEGANKLFNRIKEDRQFYENIKGFKKDEINKIILLEGYDTDVDEILLILKSRSELNDMDLEFVNAAKPGKPIADRRTPDQINTAIIRSKILNSIYNKTGNNYSWSDVESMGGIEAVKAKFGI